MNQMISMKTLAKPTQNGKDQAQVFRNEGLADVDNQAQAVYYLPINNIYHVS